MRPMSDTLLSRHPESREHGHFGNAHVPATCIIGTLASRPLAKGPRPGSTGVSPAVGCRPMIDHADRTIAKRYPAWKDVHRDPARAGFPPIPLPPSQP